MQEYTQKELSALAGYTYRRLLDINKALPDDQKFFVKGEGGKYDLAFFVQRWVRYNVARVSCDEESDLETVKAKHEYVKMQKSELQLRKMKTELVEAEAVKRVWADVVTTVTQKLMHIPTSVAPSLTMIDNMEKIEAIIDAAIRNALTMIAETPMPKVDDSFVERDDDDDEAEEDE